MELTYSPSTTFVLLVSASVDFIHNLVLDFGKVGRFAGVKGPMYIEESKFS